MCALLAKNSLLYDRSTYPLLLFSNRLPSTEQRMLVWKGCWEKSFLVHHFLEGKSPRKRNQFPPNGSKSDGYY